MKTKMRKIIAAIAITTALFLSCKKESTNEPDPNASSFDKTLIIGWWNSDASKNGLNEYKRRFFGTDSIMLIDKSNFGLGTSTAKWWWANKDTIFGQEIGSSRGVVKNLTQDSLCVDWIDFNRVLYYYK